MAVYADYTSAAEQLKSGTIRALSVGSRKRFEGLPVVPTVIESGFSDYEHESWNGLLAPAKTPTRLWSNYKDGSPRLAVRLR